MIIRCENCQIKYKIDPSKIETDKASFKCKACGEVITVTKNGAPPLRLQLLRPLK